MRKLAQIAKIAEGECAYGRHQTDGVPVSGEERHTGRMEVQSIRFGREQWQLIREAAARDGVSASQYIRDAATGRALISELARNTERAEVWSALDELVTAQPEFLDAVLALTRNLRTEPG